MRNMPQNRFVEELGKQALRGGGYHWNDSPISDATTGESGFAVAAGRGGRRVYDTSPIGAERYAPDPSFRRADPQRKFRSVAKTMENIRAESITAEVPADDPHFELGPSRLEPEDFEGSGPGNALTNVDDKRSFGDALQEFQDLLLNEDDDDDDDELAGLTPGASDQFVRQNPQIKTARDKKKRKLNERDRHVAGDRRSRGAAFDLAIPLSNEVLQSWQAYLYKKIDSRGPAYPYFEALKGFLERVGGAKRYYQLAADEKAALSGIIEKIFEAA